MDRPFVLDGTLTLGQNFHRWYILDCDEREDWGERTLDYPEAIKYFSRLHNIAAVDVQDSLEAERFKWSFMPEKG